MLLGVSRSVCSRFRDLCLISRLTVIAIAGQLNQWSANGRRRFERECKCPNEPIMVVLMLVKWTCRTCTPSIRPTFTYPPCYKSRQWRGPVFTPIFGANPHFPASHFRQHCATNLICLEWIVVARWRERRFRSDI